ncbi:serine/threonine-protein kinase, partial [Actinomadura violacea]
MSSADAGEAPLHGRHLGPYRLVRVLGEGGMGTVHLAEDQDGNEVAVKVVNRRLADDPRFRERFRREVAAARRVRPFCTAPVLDADLDGEPLYIVTEYIHGPTLDETVSRHGPLGGADLEGLAAGVATALTAVHGAGVVHRDLKPANILLSPFGPRVIDFGIAREAAGGGPLTETGETMGTPSYLAPEGLLGLPVTPAADVFAWGCVVAFAGLGRPPFDGATVGETLYRTVHEPPRLEGLEPRLRELVGRALAKDPAARPTAVGLLEELTGRTDPESAVRAGAAAGPTAPDMRAATARTPTTPAPDAPSPEALTRPAPGRRPAD